MGDVGDVQVPLLAGMDYILPGLAFKGVVIGPVEDERRLNEDETAQLKALFGSDELGIGEVYRVRIARHPAGDWAVIEVVWREGVMLNHQGLIATLPKLGEWLAKRQN